ncbi:MAG: hypothetical protein ABI651_13760 [Verrucomicrobiota bacterium]
MKRNQPIFPSRDYHREIDIFALRSKTVRVESLTLMLTLLALTSCSPAGRDNGAPLSRSAAAPVTVPLAMNKDVPVQVRAIGHVNAFSTVAVRSQVDGLLERAFPGRR